MGSRGDRFEFWFIENWWKWFLVIVVVVGVPAWLIAPGWCLAVALGGITVLLLYFNWQRRPQRCYCKECNCNDCYDRQRMCPVHGNPRGKLPEARQL